MANSYCTSSDIATDLPETYGSSDFSSTDYYDAITQACADASRLIDNEVARWPGYFYPSSDDETRYYDGSGEEVQDIDECLSITSVGVSQQGYLQSSDYTTYYSSDNDYFVEPYNYTALGVPFKRLVIDEINGTQVSWYSYRKGVKVVGIFGYSLTPPDAIKRAATIQVVRWFTRAKQNYADSGSNPQTGQLTYVKKLDPDVAELLRPYILGNSL